MAPELTPAVVRALEAALCWAHGQGRPALEPVHLLLGLLDEEEGRPAALLGRQGLSPPAICQQLAGQQQPPPRPPSLPPLPFAVATQRILDLGHEVARSFSAERTLASDQLLLALLREDEALRLELEGMGLSLTSLETEVLSEGGPALHLDEPLRLVELPEQIDAARILDAGANRAREALRVLEDYCRFALDDAFLTATLKGLRHELAEALSNLPASALLESRETLRDVGTSLDAPGENERHSLTAVAQANLKRLQEALRSLEEFGKVQSPKLGQCLETMRYRAYTLERAILLGTTSRQRLADTRLCVLATGSLCTAALDWTIQEAAAGGAGMIQLREKELGDRELLERAHNVRRWTRQADVLFILNDRPDIARLAEADGVHLGQDDLPVKEARRILGPGALIGVSTHSLDQVRQALLDGANYLGVGPAFPSGTKEFDQFPGLDFVRQAAQETSLPAFVIGGVNADTIHSAVAAGAKRVAVSQAVCQADDPREAAARLLQALEVAG